MCRLRRRTAITARITPGLVRHITVTFAKQRPEVFDGAEDVMASVMGHHVRMWHEVYDCAINLRSVEAASRAIGIIRCEMRAAVQEEAAAAAAAEEEAEEVGAAAWDQALAQGMGALEAEAAGEAAAAFQEEEEVYHSEAEMGFSEEEEDLVSVLTSDDDDDMDVGVEGDD